ncbi:fibrinogen-like protein 1 [Mytilus trossulus]|uniref:fibrinogen-like protein 1 n=1 Tax=Mytilus trossulus TaxID=6551 RepID=UPI0030063886
MAVQLSASIILSTLGVLVASDNISNKHMVKSSSDSGVCFYGATAERVLNILATGKFITVEHAVRKPKDCSDLDPHHDLSGVYRIYPNTGNGFKVYCDMKTDGGRWTVLIRRMDGSQDFNKKWIEYENGFGNLNREFWLGDALAPTHNGMRFTTSDQDNDNWNKNCALHGKKVGGWWFNACDSACFTLSYANNKKGLTGENVIQWSTWKDSQFSLKYAVMMIRRI